MRLLLTVFLAVSLQAQVSVLTYRNDLARSGQNLHETILTPGNVNPAQFGKIFSYPVDGQVYAQPLYLPSLSIPGRGLHNVVLVATEHNSVYAFDADSSTPPNDQPLWHVNLTGVGETTLGVADSLNCPSIAPEIGITGTPVIDPSTLTLYVVAASHRNGSVFHRLHALDIATGVERAGSPVVIDASVPGRGGDFFSPSPVTFLPYFQVNRAGILLLNNTVYTTWSSHCDGRSYHGWIISYSARDLSRVSVFNSTPNGNQGAFWMGGAAPAADAGGNIYAASANGLFDANENGTDFADSVLKLSSAGLDLVDSFTPFNQSDLDRNDIDLGSAGVLLLPDGAGSIAHPHLLVIAGKEGRIYLLDRDGLGGFQPDGDSQIVQSISGAIGAVFGLPAYFNNTLYFAGARDRVKAFSITNAHIGASPSSQSEGTIGYPGAVPSISASGTSAGILWLIEAGPGGALHAYDAADLSRELYNSRMLAFRDAAGPFVKFSVPTVVNGKVYVGTANSLTVFGLLD